MPACEIKKLALHRSASSLWAASGNAFLLQFLSHDPPTWLQRLGRSAIDDRGDVDVAAEDRKCSFQLSEMSYGRKWVMGSEKAAYRGG